VTIETSKFYEALKQYRHYLTHTFKE